MRNRSRASESAASSIASVLVTGVAVVTVFVALAVSGFGERYAALRFRDVLGA